MPRTKKKKKKKKKIKEGSLGREGQGRSDPSSGGQKGRKEETHCALKETVFVERKS